MGNKYTFVVMGTTGEYSDRHEWPVMAYDTEHEAQVLVEKASAYAREIELDRGSKYSAPKGSNPHDPDMQMDYTGTSYYIFKVRRG